MKHMIIYIIIYIIYCEFIDIILRNKLNPNNWGTSHHITKTECKNIILVIYS